MVGYLSVDDIATRLKRFGAKSLERKGGVSGIRVEPAARALVNDLDGHPHAFVVACIADRQTKADIAWNLPHAIRERAGDFEFDTLRQLQESEWAAVLASSGHRLATKMERRLPAAIRHIRDRYGGDASRIWRHGSSGAAVARRFLAFDGVGPKIANMAVNILIRDFGVALATPMPDIAVDTHVLRVFERLGLLDRLEHSELRSTQGKQQHRLQLRARELNPEWPGELDWPAWRVGSTWCHARRPPKCDQCYMGSVCPRVGVTSNPTI
ncbi:MAG: iron-sulfur cluster loop [Gammaproteobacteria bacterium]|nr:iron-sulfur cluster loop [Gammaproteobacteria bacterium]